MVCVPNFGSCVLFAIASKWMYLLGAYGSDEQHRIRFYAYLSHHQSLQFQLYSINALLGGLLIHLNGSFEAKPHEND